jgi:hypothetical protein
MREEIEKWGREALGKGSSHDPSPWMRERAWLRNARENPHRNGIWW